MKPIWIAMLNVIIKLIDCQICNNLLLIATKFEFRIWKMALQDTARPCSSISVNTQYIAQGWGKWRWKTNKLINLDILGL